MGEKNEFQNDTVRAPGVKIVFYLCKGENLRE